jgi:putative oxidoreductase
MGGRMATRRSLHGGWRGDPLLPAAALGAAVAALGPQLLPNAAWAGSWWLLADAGASLALATFCVATAVIFHNFWTYEDAVQYRNQFNHFMKNIALAGAFLTIAATPPLAKTQ